MARKKEIKNAKYVLDKESGVPRILNMARSADQRFFKKALKTHSRVYDKEDKVYRDGEMKWKEITKDEFDAALKALRQTVTAPTYEDYKGLDRAEVIELLTEREIEFESDSRLDKLRKLLVDADKEDDKDEE